MVVIAAGFHLFPFRTEKLSPPAPMVLRCDAGEEEAAFFQSSFRPFEENLGGTVFFVAGFGGYGPNGAIGRMSLIGLG